MSGIQSVRPMPIATQMKDVATTTQTTTVSTVASNNSITLSVPKDSIANLGKGLLAGSVPAAGIAIALKVSGSAVEHMGDGGLGLGMALMGAKPAIAASLAGGAAGALVAPGQPLKGSIAGAVTGAVTGGTMAFFGYARNPIIGAIGAITGGVAGGLGGAAGSYITKK